MANIEDIKARLERMKQNIYSEMSNAQSCKDIIKMAIKKRFPGIPERANDTLAGRIMDLDNNEILQMGKETIKVENLIDDIVVIINEIIKENEKNNFLL